MPAFRSSLRIAVLAALLGTSAVSLARAEGEAGPYLAAYVASMEGDFSGAFDAYRRALIADPTNTALMQDAILSGIGAGQIDQLPPIAAALEAAGVKNPLADLVVLAGLAGKGDYNGALAALAKGRSGGKLVDGLFGAWAELGAGQMSKSVASFDAVAKDKDLKSFALYQKGLALASVGDFEGADKLLSNGTEGGAVLSRRSIIARVEVLSQLENKKDALALLEKMLGPDSGDTEIEAMRRDLAAGKTLPFDLVRSPQDGLAELFFSLASAFASETQPDGKSSTIDILIFARVAAYLRPDLAEANLLIAGYLEQRGQHALAIEAYGLVGPQSGLHINAELGRAGALAAEDKDAEATDVLVKLAVANPDRAEVWAALGDQRRRTEDYPGAIGAYDKAIALIGPLQPQYWTLFYSRGICHERNKDWPAAEADLRKALSLNPDQPQVLNYLGYSYLEKKTNLDEALAMIERASKARPDDGAITDSLGWGLFRIGRYQEAVPVMEHAISLMPSDPVLNDHLGDVYWAVGRKREAEFQWKRALSLKPATTEEADRIRRKLDVGLDAVLKGEGAPPLTAAKNDG